MNWYSHPVLKSRTKDRLHISKEQGFLSWIALFSITFFGIFLDYYVIPDHFFIHAAFLSMCLILSLNLMKTWDLIMDRDENLGTMIHRSWYHVFSIRVPEENVERFPLSAISSVIVTSDSAIEIKRRDGSNTKITTKNNDFQSLKELRKEISSFLGFERIEYLKDTDKIFYWDMDSWISTPSILENQESDNEQDNNSQEESQSQEWSNIKSIRGLS